MTGDTPVPPAEARLCTPFLKHGGHASTRVRLLVALELAEEAAESLDLVVDAGEAEALPGHGLHAADDG